MMRSGMIDLVVYQIGGNLLLLAPLGFILPVLSARFERFRATLATVFGVSLGIEVLQLVASLLLGFAWKSFDVDDLILNTIGGVAGWIAIRLFMAAGGRRAVRRLRAAR
jgi:glycopeptide antibiotics resistance protein